MNTVTLGVLTSTPKPAEGAPYSARLRHLEVRQYDADRLVVDLAAEILEDRAQVTRSTRSGGGNDAIVRWAVDPDLHRCRPPRSDEIDQVLRSRRAHSLHRLRHLVERSPCRK